MSLYILLSQLCWIIWLVAVYYLYFPYPPQSFQNRLVAKWSDSKKQLTFCRSFCKIQMTFMLQFLIIQKAKYSWRFIVQYLITQCGYKNQKQNCVTLLEFFGGGSPLALQGSSLGLFMLSGLKVDRLSPLCSTRVTLSQPIVCQHWVQQAWWLATHASKSAGRAVSNGEHLWVLGRVDLKQRMPGATGSALAHNALPQRVRAQPNASRPQFG